MPWIVEENISRFKYAIFNNPMTETSYVEVFVQVETHRYEFYDSMRTPRNWMWV